MRYGQKATVQVPVNPDSKEKSAEQIASAFSIPEFMPGVPILPPSSRHIFSSRGDFEARFPVRAAILYRLESTDPSRPLDSDQRALIRSILKKLNNLDRYIDEHLSKERSLLREGQFEAFQNYSRFLESGGNDSYIKLPPRTGKTVLFIAMLDALGLHELGEKCLITVPTRFLADQTKARFAQFAPHLKVGIHHSKARTIKVAKAERAKKGDKAAPSSEAPDDHRDTRFNWSALPEVTIIVKNSLVNLVKQGAIRKGDFSVIFLDEAHEMLGPKTSRAVDRLRDDKTFITGFTATPKYNELKNLKVFLGPEIHSMSIQDAQEMGMLTEWEMITAESNADLSSVELNSTTGAYNPAKLERAMHEAGINESVISLLNSDLLKDRSVIVFTATNSQAEQIAKIARGVGISCEAIGQHSIQKENRKSSEQERSRKISGHQDGSIRVLVGPKLLGTGYDNPRVSAVVILVPFTSPVPVEQFSTRPLTPDPSNPNKIGLIVQYLHRDKRMQHRQMTFLDCVYGANINRYGSDKTKRGPRKGGIDAAAIPGLKLSVNASQVIKVLEKRPDPTPPHEIDESQLRYRDLIRKRDAILWGTPKLIQEIGRYAKTLQDEKGRRFAADIRSLRKRVHVELPQSLSITSTERMLLLRRHTYGEAIRHFLRRHEIDFNSARYLKSASLNIKSVRAHLDQILEPLKPFAEKHETTPHAILAYFDSRVAKTARKPSWSEQATTDTMLQLERQVAPLLEAIRSFELRIRMRWDVAFAMARELAAIESEQAVIQAEDHSESLLAFAELRAADFIARRRNLLGAAVEDFDEEVLDGLTTDDIRAIAIDVTMEVARRPKMLETLKKFSRVAAEEIRARLEAVIKTIQMQQHSFSPRSEGEGNFKTWAEVVAFGKLIEKRYIATGLRCTIEEIAAHYEEDEQWAHDRLKEYLTILPIEPFSSLSRDALQAVPAGRFSPMVGSRLSEESQARFRSFREALDRLEWRDRHIFELRYGLVDRVPKTLKEVAIEVGISRERVRQIVSDVEQKLWELIQD